jgi:hypothetical protein
MTAFKITAAAFALTLALTVGTSQVRADEVSQEQQLDQKIEIECETGSYGQTSTCKAKAKQRAEQKQKVLGTSTVTKIHDVTKVNTGLTSAQAMLAAVILTAGAASAAYKITNRAA